MAVARTDFLKVKADEARRELSPPELESRAMGEKLSLEKLSLGSPMVDEAPVTRWSAPVADESACENPDNAATNTAVATNRTFIKVMFSTGQT